MGNHSEQFLSQYAYIHTVHTYIHTYIHTYVHTYRYNTSHNQKGQVFIGTKSISVQSIILNHHYVCMDNWNEKDYSKVTYTPEKDYNHQL